MNKNLVDITLLVDRSSSMEKVKSEAEDGIMSFINKQKENKSETRLTLIEFDHEYTVDQQATLVDRICNYRLEPRGMTALLDAIGRAIDETGKRLSDMREADRPGLVVFVIMTDGIENCSRFYSSDKINEMITHKKDVYSWQFIFLGANQDSFSTATNLGLSEDATMDFSNYGMAYSAASNNVTRMSECVSHSLSPRNFFTSEEREASRDV